MRATSWTGSEAERTEQGTCAASPIDATASIPPWERDRTQVMRYRLEAGTPVKVRKITSCDRRQTEHVTRQPLEFADHDGYSRQTRVMIFRHAGYVIDVEARHVRRIDGGQPIRRS